MSIPDVNQKECMDIRSKYDVTGLYSTDNPPKLIWKLKIPFMDSGVYVGDDKESSVVPGDFIKLRSPMPEDVVATFLDRGSISSSVKYWDISPYWAIKRLLAPNKSIRVTSSEFHGVENEFVITTNVGERIMFEASSGRIKEYHDPICNWIYTIVVAGVGASALILYSRLNRSKKAMDANTRPGSCRCA